MTAETKMFDTPLPFLAHATRAVKMTLFDSPLIKGFLTCLVMLAGNFDGAYLALVIILTADLVTGTASAVIHSEFEFVRLRNAAGKWAAYYLLLILAHQAGFVSEYLCWMKEATAAFIFLTEYNSVAENLNKLGFPVPTFEKLGDFMKTLKSGGKIGKPKNQ
jgi:phage-related holin